MSKLYVCDRCKTDLGQNTYKRALIAKQPQFYFLMPPKVWSMNNVVRGLGLEE